MALRIRNYFFDPANNDRFNSKDIPTEDTMLDFAESVPFITEPGDRSRLTRAGIAKTTTDAKINAGDNTDAAGVSPSGFTTFVRPAQIPKMVDSASILWSKIARGGATNTDEGVGIEDWSGDVQFPAIVVPEDSADILTELEHTIFGLQGILCSTLDTDQNIIPAGSPLTAFMTAVTTALQTISAQFVTLANQVCGSFGVDIGDVVLTTFPSSEWNSSWLEPAGQSLNTGDYPELFAKIGYTYGGAGTSFNIPDLVSGNKYMRAKSGPVGYLVSAGGGSNSVTLQEANIPEHSHNVTGSTTTTGDHTHLLPTDNSPGSQNTVRTGGAQSGSFNIPAGGGHSHSVSGTTDSWGQNPATPITIEPEYNFYHLKMKVK